MIDSKQASKYC